VVKERPQVRQAADPADVEALPAAQEITPGKAKVAGLITMEILMFISFGPPLSTRP
jgi:hypothetical protein